MRRDEGDSAMAFDDWMGQILTDLSPFLEESGFAHVRAAAPGGSPDTNVIDFAQATARHRVRQGPAIRMLSLRTLDGGSAETGVWGPLHG